MRVLKRSQLQYYSCHNCRNYITILETVRKRDASFTKKRQSLLTSKSLSILNKIHGARSH